MAQPEADVLQVVVGAKQPEDEPFESTTVSETTPLIADSDGRSSGASQINIADLGKHYGFRRFHVILILVGVVNTMGISTINSGPYLQTKVISEYESAGVGVAHQSLVTTSITLGSIGGVLIGGFLGDRFGRRNCILLLTSGLALGGIFHLLLPSGRYGFVCMVLLRAFLGISYGGLLVLQGALVSELCGDQWRGAIIAGASIGWSIGDVYLVVCLYYFPNLSWRSVFAILPLGPLLLAVGCSFLLPESPRWLLVSGQEERAKKSLEYIFTSQVIRGRAVVGPAPTVIMTQASADNTQASLSETVRLLSSPALSKTTIGATLIYTSVAASANLVWVYGPFIVSKINGKSENDNLPLFGKAHLIGALGNLIAALLVDSLGRKGLLLMASAFKALLLMLLMIPSMVGQLEGIWLGQFLLTTMQWTVTGVYTAEVYPTDLRGRGSAFSMFFGRMVSVALPLLVGHFLDLGVSYVLQCVVSMTLLCVVCVATVPKDLARQQIPDRCLSHKLA